MVVHKEPRNGFKMYTSLNTVSKRKGKITSMFRMMTHFPLVYKKLVSLGSPPRTFATPLSNWGRLANTNSKSKDIKNNKSMTQSEGLHSLTKKGETAPDIYDRGRATSAISRRW